MKRAGPALLIAVMLLSACAAEEPRRTHYHADWLAEGPRTVRVLVGTAEGKPLYSVERHNVAEGALVGASVGMLLGGIFTGGGIESCSRDCASIVAAVIGGGAAIGALVGAVRAPGETVRHMPLEDHEETRPLAPAMQRAGQDIVARAAAMFAENLRRGGSHEVTVVTAGGAGEGAADSEIEITLSSIELVGPGPDNSARASLRVAIQVRARWRGSTHIQQFNYRSEAADLKDWADPDSEAAGQAARLAAANLAGRLFNALAEP